MRTKTYKTLRMLLTILFMVVILSSCAGKVPIYDKEVTIDLGAAGAHSNHTLVDQPRDISKADWDKERFGQLCVTSQGFSDTETALATFCSNYPGVCDYQTRQAITTTFAHIRGLILKAQVMRERGVNLE